MAYSPAPLDKLSFENGASKFVHPQKGIDSLFCEYAIDVLDDFFPAICNYSHTLPYEFAKMIAMDAEHKNKASGFPWSHLGASTKEQAINRHEMDFESCEYHVLSATLKDELRPSEKDARLFRMESVHDYLEAIQLYDEQNEYLANQIFVSPIFVKFKTPGLDLTNMFEMLEAFSKDCGDSDAAAWDANLPLSLIEIVAYWRGRFFDQKDFVRHVEYYRNMYNGYTVLMGHLYHLVGQSSGHLNTTIDNCLVNILAMSYVAWTHNLSIAEFRQQILFFVCGDDLIWSNRGLFDVQTIAKGYADLGIFLEFGGPDLKPVTDCTFVGVIPVRIDNKIRYFGRTDKFQAAICYKKKRHTVREIVSKMCSIVALSFYSPYYQIFLDNLNMYKAEVFKMNPSWAMDVEVCAYLRTTTPEFLTRLYNDWEGFRTIASPEFLTLLHNDCENPFFNSRDRFYIEKVVKGCRRLLKEGNAARDCSQSSQAGWSQGSHGPWERQS